MRVLHTSDWHLGRSFHGADILEHQRAFVVWLIDVVAAEQIDLVVVAGDIYDRAVPSLPAVDLWEQAVVGITETCPMLVTSGNHDSPTRLGFAGPLLARSGLHLRTSIADIAEPVLVEGSDGVVLAAYGMPYLEPDLHREALGAERSHAAVLDAAMQRVRADLDQRPGVRSLVAAHAFITGGTPSQTSDSERDLRVGGVGDAPVGCLSGVHAVLLGHLHGAQQVRGLDSPVHYSGSPLAFSFSEEHHNKSVTIWDIPASGSITATTLATPVPRRLVTLTGTLDELLDDPATAALADCWVRVHLTDERRPDHPMSTLQQVLPHVVELTFERRPQGESPQTDIEFGPLQRDPLTVAERFVEHVTSTPPTADERLLLRDAVDRARVGEASR